MDAFHQFLLDRGYWNRKAENPRFMATLFRGRWVIMRTSDNKMIGRWLRSYEAGDVQNFLVYLNRGTIGNEHFIRVPEKVSRTKKERLKAIKAVHASFHFKKMTMDVMYRQLKYYELPDKERAERLAWIREQAAKKENESDRVALKGFGRNKNPRGGVIMNAERDRQLRKFKWTGGD